MSKVKTGLTTKLMIHPAIFVDLFYENEQS